MPVVYLVYVGGGGEGSCGVVVQQQQAGNPYVQRIEAGGGERTPYVFIRSFSWCLLGGFLVSCIKKPGKKMSGKKKTGRQAAVLYFYTVHDGRYRFLFCFVFFVFSYRRPA